MRDKGRLLAAAMLFAGCTDHQYPEGSATVSGTLSGSAFSAMDAYSLTNRDNGAVGIDIFDFSGACALGANEKASSRTLGIISRIPAVSSGTYDVTTDLYVQYVARDATCGASIQETATAGTVTFSRIDASGIKGTFDVTFSAGEVTGMFDAPTCVGPPIGKVIECK
ncbi:MAG: hypothetical protein JO257_09465 [Deltaproteobacteria bacterium]|nr:hypothetical protein [Deltaproteobacteria bacterium]